MTRNTDNRTTDLREKLDELGIKHFDYDKGGKTQTMWESPEDTLHFTYETIPNPAKTAKLVIEWFPTPKQAIAATLGEKPRDKTEEWLLKACNQATQDYVEALEELVRDMWREITTCPDYTVPPCMTDGICERVRNLGIEMGGDGDE